MKDYEWNALKSKQLKQARGVSFEELVQWPMAGIIQHPNRLGQRFVLFLRGHYVWAAPCVIENEKIFLKTLFPSRKFTKLYWRGELL